RVDAHKTVRVAAITAAGLGALEAPFSLTPKQREVLELLAGTPTGIPTPELADRGFAAGTIARLARQALVSLRHERVNRDPFTSHTYEAASAEQGRRLTVEQTHALERLTSLAAAREFRVALLHGVTGSGKTELYLRLA